MSGICRSFFLHAVDSNRGRELPVAVRVFLAWPSEVSSLTTSEQKITNPTSPAKVLLQIRRLSGSEVFLFCIGFSICCMGSNPSIFLYNYFMTIDDIYKDIAKQKPPVIYVSGKTSTGKSTFGRKLRDELGYHVIELEAVLLEVVKKHGFDEQSTFRKVFYDDGEFEAKALFFNTTDRIISDALTRDHSVVIEGAVANIRTLERILQPAKDLIFLYFHPGNINIYIRNLSTRFMQAGENSYGGLSPKFWQLIDDDEFKKFCNTRKFTKGLKDSIEQYAQLSQKESWVRLNEFRERFKNISVVEIQ
jgi:shikimate kinase